MRTVLLYEINHGRNVINFVRVPARTLPELRKISITRRYNKRMSADEFRSYGTPCQSYNHAMHAPEKKKDVVTNVRETEETLASPHADWLLIPRACSIDTYTPAFQRTEKTKKKKHSLVLPLRDTSLLFRCAHNCRVYVFRGVTARQPLLVS